MRLPVLTYGSSVLVPYINRSYEAPFINHGHRVSPARLRTRYGLARQAGLVHIVTGAATFVSGSRLVYGARWLCGGQAQDAVLIASPAPNSHVCRVCAEAGPVVYRFFDSDDRLLYVGSTVNLTGRRKQHARADWWPAVHRESVARCRTRGEAAAAELHAIHEEQPLHNRAPRSVVPSSRGVA